MSYTRGHSVQVRVFTKVLFLNSLNSGKKFRANSNKTHLSSPHTIGAEKNQIEFFSSTKIFATIYDTISFELVSRIELKLR